MPNFWKRKRQVRTSPPSHHLSQICDKVAAQRSQRGGSRLRTGVPHLPTSHWNLNPYLEKMCLSWKQTNLLVQGWVSIDRSEVAALLSTTPRPKTRSSTNDLAPPRRMGSISCRSPRPLLGAAANDRLLRLNHRRRCLHNVDVYPCLPTAVALRVSSQIRAGFWLRGVQS